MVSEGKGRFFKIKDKKYLIYLPISFGSDSMFPFSLEKDSDIHVKVYFDSERPNYCRKMEC